MPTNANTFNSRVTSEALEAKFRQVFPAQGGAELVQDLFASGVIQPVVDFSNVAQGDLLPAYLAEAWDFSTGHQKLTGTTPQTLINNTGFWLVDIFANVQTTSTGAAPAPPVFSINDGSSLKTIWQFDAATGGSFPTNSAVAALEDRFVVFLRSGDSLQGNGGAGSYPVNVVWRQIADVNGTVVNPLGFSF